MNQLDVNTIRDQTGIQHVEVHPQLASTNDRALQLARRGAVSPPAIIATGIQTAGRGQFGKVWLATDGSLTFSLIVGRNRQKVAASNLLYSIAAANAVAGAMEELVPQVSVRLKWPNDVYVEGGKLAGILIENTTCLDQPVCVVGVGANVNNSVSDMRYSAPIRDSEIAGLSQSATSLIELTGQPTCLNLMLIVLVKHLQLELRLADGDPDRTVSEFDKRSVLRDRQVSLAFNGELVSGICAGLGPHGEFRIQTSDGIRSFIAGSVKWQDE